MIRLLSVATGIALLFAVGSSGATAAEAPVPRPLVKKVKKAGPVVVRRKRYVRPARRVVYRTVYRAAYYRPYYGYRVVAPYYGYGRPWRYRPYYAYPRPYWRYAYARPYAYGYYRPFRFYYGPSWYW